MGTITTLSRLESSEDASDLVERAGDSRPDGKLIEAGGPDSVEEVYEGMGEGFWRLEGGLVVWRESEA
jgi:hypothetical protein